MNNASISLGTVAGNKELINKGVVPCPPVDSINPPQQYINKTSSLPLFQNQPDTHCTTQPIPYSIPIVQDELWSQAFGIGPCSWSASV